jgi:hypothetical protein
MEALRVLDAELVHDVVLSLPFDALGDEPGTKRGAEAER